jgi:hypothetical protein
VLLEESCRGSKSESEGPWLELDARCKIKESFLDAWRFPKILADRTLVAVCTGEDEDILVQLLVTAETIELALRKFLLFGNSVESKLSHVCQKQTSIMYYVANPTRRCGFKKLSVRIRPITFRNWFT